MVLRLQKLQYDYTFFLLETFCLVAVSTLFLFFRLLRLLFLVIKHTVAEALEVWIPDLFAELAAHALVVLRPLETAWAVAAGALEALADTLHDLFIRIQPYLHSFSSISARRLCLSR